jgi:hypothetical protein
LYAVPIPSRVGGEGAAKRQSAAHAVSRLGWHGVNPPLVFNVWNLTIDVKRFAL